MDESTTDIRINPETTIQHWQFRQSDLLKLVAQSHHVINSKDWWAYMGIKNDHTPINPATYPQFFNESRILHFAEVSGWQWSPDDFIHANTSQQLRPEGPLLKGAVMAAWNDNGPDASTKLEMEQGDNYTLTLKATGPFTLSSSDNTLSLTEAGELIFNEDGYIYPLRSVTAEDALELDPGHPGRILVNTTSTHELVRVHAEGERPVSIVVATDVEHGAVVWI
ncbi:uncharacterized protein BDV17DRAFT_293927 [Aspergillus undulatus]|uniref:uncharacterized protein n=1 Tax=Aspergillus undulatus TaxID=1810928 RepID=UPI003CCD9CDF